MRMSRSSVVRPSWLTSRRTELVPQSMAATGGRAGPGVVSGGHGRILSGPRRA